MSFFYSLTYRFRVRNFPPIPRNHNDASSYPAVYQEVLQQALGVVDRLKGEAGRLSSLKVALPVQETGLRIEPSPHVRKPDRLVGIHFCLPKFSFPTHVLLHLRNPDDPDGSQQASRPPIFYYFAHPNADEELRSKGLAHIVSTYNGTWLNRDPYEFFKAVNNRNAFSAYGPILKKDPDVIRMYEKWPEEPPPLQCVEGYSIEQLDDLQRKLCFYSDLTCGVFPPRTLADVLSGNAYDVPRQLLNKLTLPDESFAEHQITLRVLPGSPAQRGLSKQFLESLRGLTRPVAFEVVAEGGSIYFQISCAAEDREIVEGQVQLYFEDFVIIEHSGAIESARNLHLLAALPQQPSRSSKTLGDFAVDPYNQLFNVLAQTPSTEATCAQIIFAPLASDAVNEVVSKLEAYKTSDTKEAAGKRVRELSGKLPAWSVAVRLLGTKAEPLKRLRSNFISQYETPEQK
ncbi:MAG: hypothetical protein M3362_08810, partial [Acidobacteriota bacterium]|nr:hypothetical protein [Acidobacteriota bacterium]